MTPSDVAGGPAVFNLVNDNDNDLFSFLFYETFALWNKKTSYVLCYSCCWGQLSGWLKKTAKLRSIDDDDDVLSAPSSPSNDDIAKSRNTARRHRWVCECECVSACGCAREQFNLRHACARGACALRWRLPTQQTHRRFCVVDVVVVVVGGGGGARASDIVVFVDEQRADRVNIARMAWQRYVLIAKFLFSY